MSIIAGLCASFYIFPNTAIQKWLFPSSHTKVPTDPVVDSNSFTGMHLNANIYTWSWKQVQFLKCWVWKTARFLRVSKIIVRLIKVIIRKGVVRMYIGSQIGVSESMNVYVPYWQDIKTFTGWLLKEIIVEVCKIHTDIDLHYIGSESVYRPVHSNFKSPNENRMLEGEIQMSLLKSLISFKIFCTRNLACWYQHPSWFPPPWSRITKGY